MMTKSKILVEVKLTDLCVQIILRDLSVLLRGPFLFTRYGLPVISCCIEI